MDRDLARQILTAASFVVTLAVNSLAEILALNGKTTATISDSFQVLVVPAGYVFGIWSLIYLGQGAFAVHQALPSRRADPLLRRLGLLPALAGLLNAAWIVFWHYEAFPVTVAIMIGLLVTLIAIRLRIRESGEAASGPSRWVIRLPFSIYLGWISVATIANVTVLLSWAGFDGLGLPPEAWAVLVLAAGAAIGAAAVIALRDPAIGLVFAWAYAGIVVKETDVAAVAAMAGLGAVLALAVVGAVLVRPSGTRTASGMVGARPA